MVNPNNDQVSATAWLICGAWICAASLKYKLGVLASPGTGFMPFLAGAAIFILSAVGLIQSTLKQKKGVRWKSPIRGLAWRKSLSVLASLFGYVFLVTPLGFSLCTFLFMAFLLRSVQPQRWPVVLAVSFITAVSAYLIFDVLLGAQLPKGPWGF